MGKFWSHLVHHSRPDGSDYSLVECPPLVSLRDGKTHRVEKDVLWRQDGTRIQVCMVCQPLLDEGKVTGVIVVFQDITRQLINEQKFQGCDLWLSVILNNTFEGILTINEEGVIELFNPAAERLFGYRELEVMGKNAKILLAEPYRSDPDYYFRRSLETGKDEPANKQVEIQGRRQDGQEFPLLLGVKEFVFDGRKHLVAAMSDFTGRKQFEQKLKDQQAFLEKVNGQLVVENEKRRAAEKKLNFAMGSLKKKNTELDQFASIASHDLKAPLRSIHSLANWVEEELQNEPKGEVRRYTHLMKKRIDRLVNLIDGILEYSRAGRSQGSSKRVDLQTLIRESLELSPPPSAFTIEIAPDLPPVFGDRTQLLQVFSNLVQNAINHHDRKSGKVRISFRVRDDAYEFCVADDGPGIEDKDHDRVFEIFATLDKKTGNPSHGVGLALVRKIVESQGGMVWIESAHPRGAAFWFTWPQSAPEPVLALD